MKNGTAFFHCEASLKIGTGHVMRCLTLAEKLLENNWHCSFVTSKTSIDLIQRLQNFSYLDPEEFYRAPKKSDLMVFDNYQIEVNYEKHFRNFTKKILVIDDLANRNHYCDILVDQNLGTKIEDYKNLVRKDCKILTGTDYCILRKEFSQLRYEALEKRLKTREIKNILVNFGGSDLQNQTLKALEEIENSKFLGKINAVLGFDAKHLQTIENFSKTSKNNIIIHQQANMAELIYEADLAFAAGGTSTWERCCLGLPTFLVKIADNQDKIFKELGQKESFAEFYYKVSNNYQLYSGKIKEYADGSGTNRVTNIIYETLIL